MAIATGSTYFRGRVLGAKDLFIQFLVPEIGFRDPFSITYAVFQVVDGQEELVSDAEEAPVRLSIGYYYAGFTVPAEYVDGSYKIRWKIMEVDGQADPSYAEEPFMISAMPSSMGNLVNQSLADIVMTLRRLLKDANPKRDYHFRPPDSEGYIHRQTENFGYLWADEDLQEFLQMAVDHVNSTEPVTNHSLASYPRRIRTLIVYGAALNALISQMSLWAEESFDYSIGGVSLSIDKVGYYQSLKENLKALWEKGLEEYKKSIHITKGLRQSRYTAGPKSRLGLMPGRNQITPRSWLGSW